MIIRDTDTKKTFKNWCRQFVFAGIGALAVMVVPPGNPAFAQEEHSDLHALMSAPVAKNLIASASAEKLAWTEIKEGGTSIWYATAPEFTPIKLAEYPEDDGQPVGRLQFDPTETHLYFTRGNGRAHHGHAANPRHMDLTPELGLFRLPLNGGATELVANTGTAAFNPVSGDLVISGDGGLGLISASDLKASRFESSPILKLRGGASRFTWSPDGKKAVFVSNRTSHSFIGVYDPDKETINWIAPDVSRDMYPAWSSDSSRIAFIRAPGKLHQRYFDFSDAWNFSIVVHNVDNDTSETVWTSESPSGSLFEWWRITPLLWSGTDSLIFSSETDDWFRNYELNLETGDTHALTDPACEIFDNVDRADEGLYVVSTNCDDRDRRHLSSFDLNSGTNTLLTPGTGIEVSPVILPGTQQIAYLGSTATTPMAVYLMDSDGGNKRQLSSAAGASFSSAEQVVPESVSFPSAGADGATIYGQIFKSDAPAFENAKRPAVIFLHGGPIRQMLLGWHPVSYYDRLYALNQYLASKGYVVLSVNYRAGTGYGRTYRTIDGLGPAGALEYQDVLGGAQYLMSLDDVDDGNIGLYGGSYGGFLTALGLARNSDVFAAGVDIHGVHDWPQYAVESYAKGFDDGWRIFGDELVETARLSSPVTDVDTWTSPTLFIHGDDDRNVEFGQTVDLVTRLRDLGRSAEVLVFPDEVHGFLLEETWRRSGEATAEFFDLHLGENLPREAE